MARPYDMSTLLGALETVPARPSSDYDLNDGVALAPDRRLRPAAVLIAVWDGEVVLTKRAASLKHHPSQIAFPGGKQDAGESDGETALREAREEIALPQDAAQIHAFLPPHETVTGYRVTPVLADITQNFTPKAEAGEVAEIFRVPLSVLMDPARYRIEGRLWHGATRRYWVVPHGPYYIWGATARMLKSLADRVAACG